MRRPTSPLWQHRDFMKMWTGQTISQFGSSISELALPIIAIKLLHASAFAVAALPPACGSTGCRAVRC